MNDDTKKNIWYRTLHIMLNLQFAIWSWNTCHPSLKNPPNPGHSNTRQLRHRITLQLGGRSPELHTPKLPERRRGESSLFRTVPASQRSKPPQNIASQFPPPFPTYLIYTCLNLAALADTRSCLGLNAILNLSVRICLPDRLRCSPLSNLAKRCPIGHPLQGPLLNMNDE